jgi:hypothetical protein
MGALLFVFLREKVFIIRTMYKREWDEQVERKRNNFTKNFSQINTRRPYTQIGYYY